ncbi:MAG: hypothetical protein IJ443_00495 [Firmicutes bacterium]|nr:hypothetical protein [Bacillota bacterium]
MRKMIQACKYITAILLLTLAVAVWLGHNALDWVLHADINYVEPGIEAEETRIARLNRTGVKGALAYHINAEKDYYLVTRQGEEVRLVNSQNEVVLKTGYASLFQLGAYYAVVQNWEADSSGENWAVVDTKNLRLIPKDCDSLALHKSGEYFLITRQTSDEQTLYTIETVDGGILYEGTTEASLTDRTGFAILGGTEILNLQTGEIEFWAEDPGMEILQGYNGLWVCRVRVKGQGEQETTRCQFLLNEDYEPAAGQQLFSKIEVTDGYIEAHALYNCFYDREDNVFLDETGQYYLWEAMIFDREMNLLYRGGLESRVDRIVNDIAIVYTGYHHDETIQQAYIPLWSEGRRTS